MKGISGQHAEDTGRSYRKSISLTVPETLGMAGGQANQPAARIVQIQYGFHGMLECEVGIRRGQAISGIADSHVYACFENSETELRYSRCIRQGGVEAPCCGDAWPNMFSMCISWEMRKVLDFWAGGSETTHVFRHTACRNHT